MRRSVAMSLGVALLLGPMGCRGNKCDKVEMELRAREEDVRHLREELDRSEFYNQTMSRELAAIRGEPGPLGVIEKPSEPYPVRSIKLGRQTAGRPSETCGGDDALQVQVEPIDCEGQAIKAPGHLAIEVMEVNKEGLKRPLCAWEVSQEDLRRKWQNGLLNSGYLLTFPWQNPPCTEKLRVIVRFRLVDGRMFEADKDVTIRLLPENVRKNLSSVPIPSTSPSPTVVVPGPTVVPGPSNVIPGPVTPDTLAPAPVVPAPVTPAPIVPAPGVPKPGATILPPPTQGPAVMNGPAKQARPRVELLRPIPMPPEE